MPPEHRRIRNISAILAIGALGLLFVRIDGIRITTADDLHTMAAASDEAVGQASRLLDLCIGRFYAVIKWPLLEFLMRDCGDSLLSMLRISAFLLCVVGAARFIRDALKSDPAAALFLVLACALLPVLVTYQPLFYNPMLWLGWGCIWWMGVVALQPESPTNRGWLAGLFTLALLSHEMNAVFVIWAWLARAFVKGDGLRAGFSRSTIYCGVILTMYAMIAGGMRLATASFEINYGGSTIAYDPVAALAALLANSLGTLPGLELWLHPRWDGTASPILNGPDVFLNRLLSNLGPLSCALCAGIGGITWLFLRSKNPPADTDDPPRHLTLAATLTFMVFSPNLLLSLTGKYQIWAYQQMWPYYYSWMSYLALVMILVVVLDRARAKLPGHKITTMVLSLLVALLAGIAAATAQESTDFFREYRFDHASIPPVRHEKTH